jgi:hypothetical protein
MACPVYKALLKLCPHLKDEIDAVEPNMQVSSIDFMRRHGFWNNEVEEVYLSFEESGHDSPDTTMHADGSPTRLIPNAAAAELAIKCTRIIKEKMS